MSPTENKGKSKQWQRLLEISTYRDSFENTWEEWGANAERALKSFAGKGAFPVKVVIDIEELLAWCKEHGKPVDGENRSFDASWLLKEMDKERTGVLLHAVKKIDSSS